MARTYEDGLADGREAVLQVVRTVQAEINPQWPDMNREDYVDLWINRIRRFCNDLDLPGLTYIPPPERS